MGKYIKWAALLLLITALAGYSGLAAAAEEDNVFQVFQEVLYLIENYHVEEHDTGELLKGAIKGMVETLDPFSQYMTADEFDEMQLEFEGHFGGIGIVITPELEIVSPIKGTPGERAGLKPGDMITAIDGEPTKDMTQKQAVDLMRGEPGTTVVLTIEREIKAAAEEAESGEGLDEMGKEDEGSGEEAGGDRDDNHRSAGAGLQVEILKFKIIRSDIVIPYVESEMKTGEIGYIVITQFAQGVGRKVETALNELENQGARAVILDLRSNPGGLLEEAVQVSSNFIQEGTVVSVEERFREDEYRTVDRSYRVTDLPLVILINQGSASASEIVSGAVQDYKRGKLIGMKTFGKGTVQSVIPFNDGTALRLTTGRYYTPGGRFIHEKGIEPDIKIEYDPDYEGDNQLERAIEYLQESLAAGEEFKKAG